MSGEIYQCYCMRRPQYLLDISSDRSISGSAAVARVAGAGGKLAASVGNVTRTTRLNTVSTVDTVQCVHCPLWTCPAQNKLIICTVNKHTISKVFGNASIVKSSTLVINF